MQLIPYSPAEQLELHPRILPNFTNMARYPTISVPVHQEDDSDSLFDHAAEPDSAALEDISRMKGEAKK